MLGFGAFYIRDLTVFSGNLGQNSNFVFQVTLQLDGRSSQTTGHLFLYLLEICASFHNNLWIKTGVISWKCWNCGQIDELYATSKVCGSFCGHQWIQYWSYSPEMPKLVPICFDLCDLDLWPWPFAWTSFLLMAITLEYFMMMRWQELCEIGVMDRQMDSEMERTIYIVRVSCQKCPICDA